MIPTKPHLLNPAPALYAGWPRPYWDYFNAPGRSGYNPDYEKPGDPVGHKGVDLGAPERSPMLACYNQKIHYLVTPATNPQAGWGVEAVTEVAGGWWGFRYLHCPEGSLLVRPGDQVTKGQTIGQVGKSGNANYPHIHFEVRWLTTLHPGSLVSQGTVMDPLFFGLLQTTVPVEWPVLLHPADTHPCVPALRGMLYGLGYLTNAGGTRTYTAPLVAACKRFQKEHALTPDGVVGPQTRRRLGETVEQSLGGTP